MRLIRVLLVLVCSASASKLSDDREADYERLLAVTPDKEALEAIKELHRQLDDDRDGAIEPSETGDFIRADLKRANSDADEKRFHKRDEEITVNDLWTTWRASEVHNWTAAQVSAWVAHGVELPRYADAFLEKGVNGSDLPKVAANSLFLKESLGIVNGIHRSKIALKAMDVVLFGAPRDKDSFFKDAILTTLLVVAVSGLAYAYRVNRRSQEHLRKMMSDMDALSKAEQTLVELQEKLQQKDDKIQGESKKSALQDAFKGQNRNIFFHFTFP